MIRLRTSWLATLVIVIAFTGIAAAEDIVGPPSKLIADRVAALGLDEATQAQVLAVFEAHKAAMEAWKTENQPALDSLKEQFRAAREAGDQEALKALGEQFKELMAGQRQIFEDLKTQLSGLLTEEQLAALRPHRGPGMMGPHRRMRHHRPMIRGFIKDLELTPEQVEAAKAIFAEAREAAAAAETLEAKGELFKAAMQKVHDEVLNEAQQAKAAEMKQRFESLGLPEELKLTDAQLEQMKTIHAEVKAAVEAAQTPEAKRQAFMDGFKRMKEVLTEEQSQALRESFQKLGGPDGCGFKRPHCGGCCRGGQEEVQPEAAPEVDAQPPEVQHLD